MCILPKLKLGKIHIWIRLDSIFFKYHYSHLCSCVYWSGRFNILERNYHENKMINYDAKWKR